MNLGLVGHELGEGAAEPDRLGREVAAAAVALVEDQVDDGQHRGEPVGQQVRRRHAERDPAALIFRFARTSRLAIVASGTRNARAISSSSRPPSVRSVSATCASSASAGWQHVKRSSSRSSGIVVSSTSSSMASGTSSRRVFAASVRSRRMRSIARLRAVVDEPRARVCGRALAGPPLGCDRERLLGGFLGEVEVAEEADQACEDAAPLVAERPARGSSSHSATGRTSTAPPMRAAGMRDASSIAASRSSASKRR